MSLVNSSVLEGRGVQCAGFLLFVMRKRKLGGNAGWRGGHAFHWKSADCGSGKACFEDGDG